MGDLIFACADSWDMGVIKLFSALDETGFRHEDRPNSDQWEALRRYRKHLAHTLSPSGLYMLSERVDDGPILSIESYGEDVALSAIYASRQFMGHDLLVYFADCVKDADQFLMEWFYGKVGKKWTGPTAFSMVDQRRKKPISKDLYDELFKIFDDFGLEYEEPRSKVVPDAETYTKFGHDISVCAYVQFLRRDRILDHKSFQRDAYSHSDGEVKMPWPRGADTARQCCILTNQSGTEFRSTGWHYAKRALNATHFMLQFKVD